MVSAWLSVDHVDQVAFGDDGLGAEQANAVREHIALLVVVRHPGDRAAFDHRQHQQHGLRRVAQHDADDVAVADTARGEHGGVPVNGLVGLPVGQLLVAELDEHLVGGLWQHEYLKHLADGRLRRRASQKAGQGATQDDRGVQQQAGHVGGDVQQPDAAPGPRFLVGHAVSPLGVRRFAAHPSDRHHGAGAHTAIAASTSSTTISRSSAAWAT